VLWDGKMGEWEEVNEQGMPAHSVVEANGLGNGLVLDNESGWHSVGLSPPHRSTCMDRRLSTKKVTVSYASYSYPHQSTSIFGKTLSSMHSLTLLYSFITSSALC
jgi:hypothetical protein